MQSTAYNRRWFSSVQLTGFPLKNRCPIQRRLEKLKHSHLSQNTDSGGGTMPAKP
jgi:hypothetical protein